MDKVLEIKNLTVSSFVEGDVEEKKLDDVSFDVFSGQIVGIVGATGSGKTLTMLSVMNMLPDNMKIKSGEIIFMGKNLIGDDNLSNKMSGEKGISMIFQNQRLSLSPIFKISSQMKDIIRTHKNLNKKITDGYCLDVLSKVGFKKPKEVYDKYPFELSGGMIQRVVLAIAVAISPRLLIADEPTTALDMDIQSHILMLIKDYHKTWNNSIIIVTHDFSVIKKICTHVIVMKDGKVVEKGLVDYILRNPQREYTKQLIDINDWYI